MSMNEAQATKRQQLINRANGKTDEPFISADTLEAYSGQLSKALNWYANEADSKQRKAWAISYFKKLKENATVDHLSEISDWEFHSLGVLLRMKSRGCFLSDKEEQYIITRTQELLQKTIQPKQVTQAKPAVVVNIQDRILEKSREIGGEIDGQIDDFVTSGCPANFKVSMNGISTPVAKLIADFYRPLLSELQEVLEGNDEQLVEGYSNFTKPQLKRFISLIETIISNCEQAKKVVVRKPRARKAKPAGEIVKNLKFKKEDTDLGIKSISAPTIVGANELWVYNTKYRKLQVYRAIEGGMLTVKGTSILNYDTKTSGSKTLRKPAEQLVPMMTMSKRPMNAAYKLIKGTEATPNGRINEECVLVKVY